MNASVVVIGVGNIYRRDDALGPTVIELLRERDIAGVSYAESDGEPIQLIELWQNASCAVVVDAVRVQPARPGRIHRLRSPHPGAAPTASSHGVDLGDTVELARALDRLPERLLIYAVEVADTDFGVGLSPQVAAAACEVADEIASLVTAGVPAG